MKVLDRTINAWQTGILIFVLMFANKILVLPSLLFERAKIESIFVLFFFFLLEFGVLFLFFKLKSKFPNETFAEILRTRFGNFVKIFFYVAFMIFFLSKAVLLYNVTYIFFRNLIYKDTSNLLILFCFLPIINHLAICGLRVMGRTLQLFFPVLLGILLFCLIVGVFGINSRVIWFQSSFVEILLTGANHIAPFGDIIFLFLIMDRVQIKKQQWAIPFTFFALSSVIVIAVALVFMLSYTYTSFMHPYAIFEIVSFVKEFGGLGRIDIIAMVAIIMLAYFHLAIYLKSFMFAFEGVFQNVDKIYSVLLFNFAFVLVVIFFIINLETAVTFGEQILPFATIFPYCILPIFVIIALCMKNKRKNKFQKNSKNAANLQANVKNPEKVGINISNFRQFSDIDAQNVRFLPAFEKFDKMNKNERKKKKILKKTQKIGIFNKKLKNPEPLEVRL